LARRRYGKSRNGSVERALCRPLHQGLDCRLLRKSVAQLQAIRDAAPEIDADAMQRSIRALHHKGGSFLCSDDQLVLVALAIDGWCLEEHARERDRQQKAESVPPVWMHEA